MQIVCLRGRGVVSLSSSMTLDIDLKSIMALVGAFVHDATKRKLSAYHSP